MSVILFQKGIRVRRCGCKREQRTGPSSYEYDDGQGAKEHGRKQNGTFRIKDGHGPGREFSGQGSQSGKRAEGPVEAPFHGIGHIGLGGRDPDGIAGDAAYACDKAHDRHDRYGEEEKGPFEEADNDVYGKGKSAADGGRNGDPVMEKASQGPSGQRKAHDEHVPVFTVPEGLFEAGKNDHGRYASAYGGKGKAGGDGQQPLFQGKIAKAFPGIRKHPEQRPERSLFR